MKDKITHLMKNGSEASSMTDSEPPSLIFSTDCNESPCSSFSPIHPSQADRQESSVAIESIFPSRTLWKESAVAVESTSGEVVLHTKSQERTPSRIADRPPQIIMEPMVGKHVLWSDDEEITVVSSNASTLTTSVSPADGWSFESRKDIRDTSTCQHALSESNIQASLAERTANEMQQVLEWWNRKPQDQQEVRDQADDLPGNALASHQEWLLSQSSTTAHEETHPNGTFRHEDALAQAFLVDQAIERTRAMELIILEQRTPCCGELPDKSNHQDTRSESPRQATHQASPLLLEDKEQSAPHSVKKSHSPPRNSHVWILYLVVAAAALILEAVDPFRSRCLVQSVFVIYLAQTHRTQGRLLGLFLLPVLQVFYASAKTMMSMHAVQSDDEKGICVAQM